MFEDCTSLSELTAARVKLSGEVDLTELNNAYNKRRQEILSTKKNYVIVKPVVVKPRPVKLYAGVPVCGKSSKPGVIQFTEKGFLH